VPIEHSRKLAQDTGMELIEIPDGDHRLNVILEGRSDGNGPLIDELIARVTAQGGHNEGGTVN
jgi:hypothetical protein